MIPVLGVPVLVGQDLLGRMLDSIDVRVGRLVVIDNGGVVDDGIGGRDVEVVRPGRNLGVAASWNRIVAEAVDAPWWAIVGFDLVFAPGDLGRLSSAMEDADGPLVALLGTFSAFGINRAAVDTAGLFDENFHPAYFEDNDYDRRCQLTGVPLVGLPAGLSHRISSTLALGYRGQNARTFPVNASHYVAKWGGPPRGERFQTPFDRGGSPSLWTIDEDRVARQSWDVI